jgi:hypothetical protein
VAATPFGIRVVVGDVCGKGLDGVRQAATVTGAFRQAAFGQPRLTRVVADLDAAVTRDSATDSRRVTQFVTAVLVEFTANAIRVVNCGHPPPIMRRAANQAIWSRAHGA